MILDIQNMLWECRHIVATSSHIGCLCHGFCLGHIRAPHLQDSLIKCHCYRSYQYWSCRFRKLYSDYVVLR